MTGKETMAQRTLDAITAVATLIALALGLTAYIVTDKGALIAVWVVLAVMGVVLAATSLVQTDSPGDYGPSQSNYRFALGAVMLIAGAVGYIATFSDAGAAVTLLVAILAIAVLAAILTIKNRK
ncbi:MAG: hypothetical protein GX224_00965 [Thermoplasmatales archaeon]|nr:hypothetical protein [Thermoplasmatales archaeon]